MKDSLFTVSVICLLAVMLVSCHKHDGQQTQSTYTFTNTTGKRITFDIYNSKEDYYQNTNRTQQYFIEPGANQEIVFDAPRTCWIDWHSADYSYNNWPVNNGVYRSVPVPLLPIATESDHLFIVAKIPDTIRSVILNGSDASSTWVGTLAGSSALSGTHRFIFRKDLTVDYIFTDINRNSTTTSFIYIWQDTFPYAGKSQGFSLYLGNEKSSMQFNAACYLGYYGVLHTGRDTMIVNGSQSGFNAEFPVVRQ